MFDKATPRLESQTPDSVRVESRAFLLSAVQCPGGNERVAEASAVFASFVDTVERLERILELETELLGQHQSIALTEFNHKKSQGLLELSRTMAAMRGLDLAALGFDAKTRLGDLRLKLQKNLRVLQMHMSASAAVATIIARAIQEHESDGTYTAELGAHGKTR
ncbi:hypothetical protein CU048_01730 [Beijerinckiaceae bacterium]|nr:hypothetical protein CU048_01730 [Beijerinckiaceae bacterium]